MRRYILLVLLLFLTSCDKDAEEEKGIENLYAQIMTEGERTFQDNYTPPPSVNFPPYQPTTLSAAIFGNGRLKEKIERLEGRERELYQTEMEIASLAREVGWPEYQIRNVLKRSFCESTWNEHAVNMHKGEFYLGCMQVWEGHASRLGYGDDPDILFSCRANLEISLVLYQESGWDPWEDTDKCVNLGPKGASWRELIIAH